MISRCARPLKKWNIINNTAVPILNRKGNYIGTVTEGDLLRIIKEQYTLSLHDAEDVPIWQVPRRWTYEPVNINCNIEDLIELSMRQNFVPVVTMKVCLSASFAEKILFSTAMRKAESVRQNTEQKRPEA